MARLSERGAFSLARVVNATGVVLHTNLGRALLSPLARERLQAVAGGVLESRDGRGPQGARLALRPRGWASPRLTGAEASLVVNNCAAAVLLALESLARGKEVIVSRGELIEIGGEFRIPDIMRRSGAMLREVGTTNRTHLKDYAQAIGPETGLLLKVHTSNYRVVGFTAAVSSRELAELGRERGVPVMEDLGSGCLVDLRRFGFPVRAHRARGRGLGRRPRVVLRRQAARRAAGGHRRRQGRAGRAPRPEPAQPRAPDRQVHRGGARGDALRVRGGRRARDHPDAPHADRAAVGDQAPGARAPAPPLPETQARLGADPGGRDLPGRRRRAADGGAADGGAGARHPERPPRRSTSAPRRAAAGARPRPRRSPPAGLPHDPLRGLPGSRVRPRRL